MSIGIIGAGAVGSNLVRWLAKSGISTTIANRRGPQSLKGLVDELGPSAQNVHRRCLLSCQQLGDEGHVANTAIS